MSGAEDQTRRRRITWVLFLAGPVIWYSHFWVVYLLAEAICEAGGFHTRWLGYRPLSFVTLAATVAAGAATLWFTYRAWRWRPAGTNPQSDMAQSQEALTFIGVLLGLVFFVSILFVGVPALFLRPC